MHVKSGIDSFSPAVAIRQALRRREISSRELLESHLDRIAKHDPAINSIVLKDFDRAHAAAKAADERRASGDEGPLLGLPISIKESLDVEGLPSTAGVEARRGHVAPADSQTVARLRAAGAVIIGKTNICTWLADYLSGRTDRPSPPQLGQRRSDRPGES